MNIRPMFQLSNKAWWAKLGFYGMVLMLLVTIFFWLILWFKTYLQNERITELDRRIAAYGTSQQKNYEKEVFDYKKKVDDFSSLLDNHRITSNIFAFLEEKTLPQVWFSNFDMSQSSSTLNLIGEAETSSVFSKQVALFEQSKDKINQITILSSQMAANGKIQFTLSLVLNPAVFKYASLPVAPATSVSSSAAETTSAAASKGAAPANGNQ